MKKKLYVGVLVRFSAKALATFKQYDSEFLKEHLGVIVRHDENSSDVSWYNRPGFIEKNIHECYLEIV